MVYIVPQLPYPFVCWWASRLLPRPGYDKQCCDEHWGARVSFRSGFLGVCAQKWDCWVVWQILCCVRCPASPTFPEPGWSAGGPVGFWWGLANRETLGAPQPSLHRPRSQVSAPVGQASQVPSGLGWTPLLLSICSIPWPHLNPSIQLSSNFPISVWHISNWTLTQIRNLDQNKF